MSIRSIVTDFLDKIVDARFKRDPEGRLIFFPLGFGSGRLVPDNATEARLRLAYRRLTIAIFVVVIPALSAFNGIHQLNGFAFLGYFLAAIAIGIASQLYLVWVSRHLQRSAERMSYSAATMSSLDRFGRSYLVFGLATSLAFTALAALMLVFVSDDVIGDQVVMAICLLVFAPLSVIYALALWRRQSGRPSAA